MENNPDLIHKSHQLSALLRRLTPARVGLDRTGHSQTTKDVLLFNMAHAEAKDAVKMEWNINEMTAWLEMQKIAYEMVESQAKDKNTYLSRPDLGRQLSDASISKLRSILIAPKDIAIVIADGLSSRAVSEQIPTILPELLHELDRNGFTHTPIVLAKHGRVAIADEIGEYLKARCALILIGERPGLSSPDSLGAYLTFAPQKGMTDESRNCISNIRPQGLAASFAAIKIIYLLKEAFRLQLSGVALKDNFSAQNII